MLIWDILCAGSRINAQLSQLHDQGNLIMSVLDTLKAQVARAITVEESAIVLIQGLKQKLDDAIAAGVDQAALQALSDSIGLEADKLAASITANTPADPAPPAPPVETPPAEPAP